MSFIESSSFKGNVPLVSNFLKDLLTLLTKYLLDPSFLSVPPLLTFKLLILSSLDLFSVIVSDDSLFFACFFPLQTVPHTEKLNEF